MKKLILILSFLSASFISFGQTETNNFTTYDTIIQSPTFSSIYFRVRISRPLNMFTANHPDTASRPAFFMIPGQGQMGTNYANLQSYGPHYWINNGWNRSIVTGSGTHYPILFTIISTNTFMTGIEASDCLEILLNVYHVKRSSVHVIGFSQGGFAWSGSLLYSVSGDERGMRKVKSMVCLQGATNEINATTTGSGTLWGHWAAKYGGKFFGLEGTVDQRYVDRVSVPMNDSSAGSAYFAFENIAVGGSAGSHCCWNEMMNPARTNWKNTPTLGPNVVASADFPSRFATPGNYRPGDNIFTWMFKQGDTTLVGSSGGNQSPVANAGTDRTITLPTSSIVLTGGGTDADGTITTYAWTRISGPNTPTLSGASTATLTIGATGTAMIAGTYVYRLTVTDNNSATAFDEATIIVNATPTSGLFVKEVGISEYKVGYLGSDNNAYAFSNNSMQKYDLGARSVVKIATGFNTIMMLDDQGYIWNSNIGLNTAVRVDTDTTGAPFNGNISLYGYGTDFQGRAKLSIRNSDSTIWYWGDDPYALFAGTNPINKPIQLSPVGMKAKKIVLGYYKIVVLTTNGQVWEWNRFGSITPIQKTLVRPAIDIAGSHFDYNVAVIPDVAGSQVMGYPYVWGTAYGQWGGTTSITQPTSVKTLWGVTVPIKEIVASYSVTHYIDSLGRMFGIGDNVQGEIGNGYELVNKADYCCRYAWNLEPGSANAGAPPVQIGSGITWKRIWADNTLSFSHYAQDVNDSLYSWGNNKALALGNGYLNLQEAGYRNALDVLTPTMVSPLFAKYQGYNFIINTINAGNDQNIVTTSTTLSGSGTPTRLTASGTVVNGKPNLDYIITGYQWTKVSGPSCTITTPTAATTTVTGMSTGVYVFKLVITDNNTATIADELTVNVNTTSNQSPTVDAGSDVTIVLPTNQAALSGTASDPDGTITSSIWSIVSQPGGANAIITSPTSLLNASAIGLSIDGTYVIKLTVTDNSGATAEDTKSIFVNAAASGSDKTVLVNIYGGTGAVLTGNWNNWNVTSSLSLSSVKYSDGAPSTITMSLSNHLSVSDNGGSYVTTPMVIDSVGRYTSLFTGTRTVTLSNLANTTHDVQFYMSRLNSPAVATISNGVSSIDITQGNNSTQAATFSNMTPVNGVLVFTITTSPNYLNGFRITEKGTAPPQNILPTANAGDPQIVLLPNNTTTLFGSGSDIDGSIVSYAWTQVSGTSATIVNGNTPTASITGLGTAGVRIFRLTVTDNSGGTGISDVVVTVNATYIRTFKTKVVWKRGN
jgi:alpha-tubulin suppressor-like RCC1 family protein